MPLPRDRHSLFAAAMSSPPRSFRVCISEPFLYTILQSIQVPSNVQEPLGVRSLYDISRSLYNSDPTQTSLFPFPQYTGTSRMLSSLKMPSSTTRAKSSVRKICNVSNPGELRYVSHSRCVIMCSWGFRDSNPWPAAITQLIPHRYQQPISHLQW